MARTPEGAQLTEAHRLLQGRISAGTIRDLLTLWALVDPTNLKGTIDPFTRAGLVIVQAGRRASATAAQRYYGAFRHVEGVRGAVAVTMPPPLPDAVAVGAIKGGGLAGIMRARSRGLSVAAAHQNGFVRLSGGAAQLVAGGGRETLLGAIQGDREATGWQRVTDGDPCSFCAMIAGQGILAKDEAGASFEAHGHCGCTAEPAFEGSSLRPANAQFRAAWNEATAGLSGDDARNAFRRSWSTTN